MTETVTENEPAEAGRRVADDVACYRCGYSLRGLDIGGLCPECGGPVDESAARHAARLRGDVVSLAASDPRIATALTEFRARQTDDVARNDDPRK